MTKDQPATPSNRLTIAVLPFVNHGEREDLEYLGDGITEELIHALSRVRELRVTSRTSSFLYKNRSLPLRRIGQELNVAHVLEGSVRLSEDTLRISVTLVDVAEDVTLWTQTFDRPVEDIFALQDELSLLIADRLREHVGHFAIADRLVYPPPVGVEHYRLYLKSRYHILKMSRSEIETGMAMLREITQARSDYPLAHVGLHLGYTLLGTLGMLPAARAFAAADVELKKAEALDADLPEIQLHLAYRSFLQDWDLPTSYRRLHRSFELRPSVEYYQSMASVLVAERKTQAAHHYLDIALQLDPFSDINHHLKGFVYYIEENYERAIAAYRKSLDIKPDSSVSLPELGRALWLAGRHEEAVDLFDGLPAATDELLRMGGLAIVCAALARPRAEANVAKLEQALEGPQMDRALNLLIIAYAVLGRSERALDLLARALELRLPMLVYTYLDPLLKPLRSSARFQQLSRQLFATPVGVDPPRRKYKKPLFDAQELAHWKAKLLRMMETEAPYLEPDLTLRGLAGRLDLPANYLSQLLNEGLKQNFSEFVNSYRLEAFRAKVARPEFQHLTLLGLAYECGFNSKTVFNTFFRKTTGMTPAAYRDRLLSR